MTKVKPVLWILLVIVPLVVVATAGAETPEEIYSFANHLKRDGLNEAAAQQFLRFARENPTDRRSPVALYNAAECLVDAGDPEKAVSILETLTQNYPDHAEQCSYQLQLGRLYYKLERYEAADRAFTQIVVTMPECPSVPDALLGKGEALISLKNFRAAREVLSSIVTNHLESGAAPRASYNLAFCLRRLGRDAEALETYERLVERFPGDPLVGFGALEAARMYRTAGNSVKAIAYFDKARAFDASVFYVPASLEGGELLETTGDYRRALSWYEELLARPDVEQAQSIYLRAVSAAFKAQDYRGVHRVASQFQSHYPNTFSPQITYFNARAFLEGRDFNMVLEEAGRLEKFAAGSEWATSALSLRGEASLATGASARAVDELSLFVSVSSDSGARVDVLRKIADVSFLVTRDTTRALAALDRLLEIERRRDPDDILFVGSAYEKAGRSGEAWDVYEDLLTRFPLSDAAGTAEEKMAVLDEITVTDFRAAAAEMDRVAYRMVTQDNGGSLIDLAEARVSVTRNFQGALAIVERLKNGDKNRPEYARILFLEGYSHSKLARRAGYNSDRDLARKELKKAVSSWEEVVSKYKDSTWAVRAAFEMILVKAAVEDRFDTREAEQVLSRYPDSPFGARVAELLGDQYAGRADEASLTRAASLYARAITADRNSARLRLKHAKILVQQNKHEDALAALEWISRQDDPRLSLSGSFESGRVLRHLKRYAEAIPYFERVARADAGGSFGAGAALQAADCLYMQKDYAQAETAYRTIEASAPDESRRWLANYRIGLCLIQSGDDEGALKLLRECVELPYGGTTRSSAFVQAADLAAKLGDDDARLAILEAFVGEVTQGEEVAGAKRDLVRLYIKKSRAKEAFDLAAGLARSAAKEDVEPRALMAMALYQLGEVDRARRETDEVARVAGTNATIVSEIGVEAARYYFDHERYKDAAESIKPYASTCNGPGVCEEARYVYAMSLFAEGDLKSGNSVAQAFFRDYPLSRFVATLHLRMGNLLATAGRTSESLLHYEEAAETATDNETAFLALKNLGVSYHKLNQWADGEKVWQRVLRRFKDDEFAAEAALNIARCKMEQGHYTEAIEAYKNAMPMLDSEDRARAFYWMGTSYEQLGDYQSAVVEYLKVSYLAAGGGMWIVTAQLKAAECYVKLDRKDAARDIYAKVLRNHGATSNWGKLAQKGLDSIDGTKQASEGGGQ